MPSIKSHFLPMPSGKINGTLPVVIVLRMFITNNSLLILQLGRAEMLNNTELAAQVRKAYSYQGLCCYTPHVLWFIKSFFCMLFLPSVT